jgi:hypothetical protein
VAIEGLEVNSRLVDHAAAGTASLSAQSPAGERTRVPLSSGRHGDGLSWPAGEVALITSSVARRRGRRAFCLAMVRHLPAGLVSDGWRARLLESDYTTVHV